jgi:hypothetical protein
MKGFSKWYPSVQIFRQSIDGDWAERNSEIQKL